MSGQLFHTKLYFQQELQAKLQKYEAGEELLKAHVTELESINQNLIQELASLTEVSPSLGQGQNFYCDW